MEQAWQESVVDCFMRSLDCVARLSPDLSSWKTYLPLLQEEAPKWSGKLPRWGTIVDGALYPLQALEPCIDGKDGSYWLTPRATEITETYENYQKRMKANPNPKNNTKTKAMNLTMQVQNQKLWPTPMARDWKDSGYNESKERHSLSLPIAVMKQSVGRLNPEMIGKRLSTKWVSVMMGYPIKWLDLEPLEIPLSLPKLQKLFKF